jgi:iron complex transport system permease protein
MRTVGLGVGTGVLSGVVGLLPWIVTGMRLPLQNLWATPTVDPADMPVALLPFSQYSVGLIGAMLLVGGTVAGLAVRLLGERRGLPGRLATVLAATGLLVVQLVALVQTAVVTGAGLRTDRSIGTGAAISAAQVYLVALMAGTLLAIALAVVLLVVLARTAPGVAVVAVAVGALAAGTWVDAFLVSPVGFADGSVSAVLSVTRWVPAVLVGLGIARTGLTSVGRVIGSVLALAVLWSGSAAVTAVTAALGTRVYLPYPLELASFGAEVFRSALGPAGTGIGSALVALVIGGAGALVWRWWRARRGSVAR